METKKLFKVGLGFLMIATLSGCASMNQDKKVNYDPSKYIPVDQVADYVKHQKIKKEAIELELDKITPSRHAVLTSYGFSQNPKLLEAYQNYTAGKEDVAIKSKGYITYPYDAYSHPLIACAPLRVCSIQLEKGEQINNVSLGDTKRWKVTKVLVGKNKNHGSWIIEFKPAVITDNISTDLVIATDKRVYQLGLVSKRNADTHMVNFYYPEETLNKINADAVQRYMSAKSTQSISGAVDQGTVVNTMDINTNYTFTGDTPAWKPVQVYDDGNKTFIKMPKLADRMTLPIIWVLTPNGHKEPLNARYSHPYYILDGLYQKVFLISGVNKHKVEVTINNNNITNK
jgi:P-type conjugative transfer protein TrbG